MPGRKDCNGFLGGGVPYFLAGKATAVASVIVLALTASANVINQIGFIRLLLANTFSGTATLGQIGPK